MTKSDKKFFEVARGVSQLSDFSRIKIGCIVVDGKRILSSGYNSNKTNPTQQRYNYYRNIDLHFPAKVHAEVSALNSLIGKKEIDFARLKVFVYRELCDGTLALARPCPSCLQLIRDLGITKIFYTTKDGFAEEHLRKI